MPQRSALLGEYLLNQGQGTVAVDSSGLGNDGTIAGPSWEGRADLNFSAVGQYISVPSALNQANTWQFAVYSPPYGSAVLPQAPGYGARSDFPLLQSLLAGTTSDLTLEGSSSHLPFVSSHFGNTANNTETIDPFPVGWHVVTIVGGQNGALDHIYYDGAEVQGYQVQDSGYFKHSTTGHYQIGGIGGPAGAWTVGKIAGAWAWSTSLSAADAQLAGQSALSYMQSKGASRTYSPIVHSAPVIVGGIDSRTYGIGLQNGAWIEHLTLNDSSYTNVNLGIPGATLYDRNVMFPLLDSLQMSANTAPTIAIFWGGVNDWLNGDEPISDVVNSMYGLVQQAKAAGAKVIVATEISSGVTNGDSQKNAFNSLLRTQVAGWGVDDVVELATIPQMGTDGQWQTSYFADGLHPSDAGEVYITQAMSNVVNELLGSTAAAPTQISAVTYQEQAADRFLLLNGTGAQGVTLPSCVGYFMPRSIMNASAGPASVSAVGGEMIRGSQTIAAGTSALYTPTPMPAATGGCFWTRTQ